MVVIIEYVADTCNIYYNVPFGAKQRDTEILCKCNSLV